MQSNEEKNCNPHHKNRFFSGLILLAVGILLLGNKMGLPVPDWIFTWPSILIIVGLFVGVRSNFRNAGAFIMIVVGSIFLADNLLPNIDLHNYLLPIILIIIGLFFILRPKHYTKNEAEYLASPAYKAEYKEYYTTENDNSEFVEINAVFSGIKKTVLSKNFRGAEVNCFMGGSEINLLNADIQHPVIIEVNNVFGGTKLILPSNWDIKNEVTAVFGGVEDKRNIQIIPDANKSILLKGTCVFGGIEIKNF